MRARHATGLAGPDTVITWIVERLPQTVDVLPRIRIRTRPTGRLRAASTRPFSRGTTAIFSTGLDAASADVYSAYGLTCGSNVDGFDQ